jgi:hypothetical protein
MNAVDSPGVRANHDRLDCIWTDKQRADRATPKERGGPAGTIVNRRDLRCEVVDHRAHLNPGIPHTDLCKRSLAPRWKARLPT